MRIAYVSRTAVFSKRNSKGKVIESTTVNSEAKIYPKYSGRIVPEDSDLPPLLEAHLPAGHYLEEMTDQSPIMDEENLHLEPSFIRDGDSKPLPSGRIFGEFLEGSSSPSGEDELLAYWTVGIDRTVGVRKEQVSLTLSSGLLERLRSRAKERKCSLSGLIDEYLAAAIEDSSASYRDKSEHLLDVIEQMIEDFREGSRDSAVKPLQREGNAK